MNVLAIIQARLGSSRLPGKSVLPLPLAATGDANTILGRVVARAHQARRVDEVLIATTTQPQDDELAALATRLTGTVYRGDEDDVLGRFAGALEQASPAYSAVVRLTADNPALDPGFLDQAIDHHVATRADYTYTTGLPLGTNLEIIGTDALLRAHREAHLPDEREHVTPYLRRHPALFRLETLAFSVPPNVAALRLTVDYASDYALMSILYNTLGPAFMLADLHPLIGRHPWLAEVNQGNVQR